MSNCSLQIRNLKYEIGNYLILNDLNFEVRENSFVALIGPNGGGKTTLLKMILGLLKPSEGEIVLSSEEVKSITAELVGYVPQIKSMDRLFPAKVYELVATGIRNSWITNLSKSEKAMVLEALSKVGAEHLSNRQLSKLSGGELQRIYLARSFIRRPKILLLDEPATGIDIVGEKDIYHLIESYRKETDAIVMMVTHDWEAAYHHADYVLVLNHKQICYDEPKKAFREDILRKAFSHVGHKHEIIFKVDKNG